MPMKKTSREKKIQVNDLLLLESTATAAEMLPRIVANFDG